jgi:tRNA(Ile)-lysidine synthase
VRATLRGVSTEVEARVRAGGLLEPGRPVVVMLSGGRDSVCLLDLAIRIAGRDHVIALHVDYGLRDSAADDAAFCAALCERLGVALEVRRAGSPEGNLQAWARERRYAEAAELAGERDALIAAGHTATDQVETVLYRLAASPGRRALLGMPERDGRLIRPLLACTREETADHCRARGLPWREDPSNAELDFTRNRVRHELLPALRRLHPAAEKNVLRTLALLRDEAAVLDELVAAATGEPEVEKLRALPPALARLVVQALADEAARADENDATVMRLHAPAIGHRIDEILALAGGGGSASLDVGGGLRAVVEYGRLRFEAAQPAAEPVPVTLPVPGRVAWDGGELACERGPDLPLGDGVLDAAALGERLEVRAWRAGDRMRPLGLGGTRTLQDLFTDRKVPRERRRRIPVVAAGGEIAWVPGVATGERFRVTGETTVRVRLTWVQRPEPGRRADGQGRPEAGPRHQDAGLEGPRR